MRHTGGPAPPRLAAAALNGTTAASRGEAGHPAYYQRLAQGAQGAQEAASSAVPPFSSTAVACLPAAFNGGTWASGAPVRLYPHGTRCRLDLVRGRHPGDAQNDHPWACGGGFFLKKELNSFPQATVPVNDDANCTWIACYGSVLYGNISPAGHFFKKVFF